MSRSCGVRAGAVGRQTTAAGEAEWLVTRKIGEARRYDYTLVNAPAEMTVERVVEL